MEAEVADLSPGAAIACPRHRVHAVARVDVGGGDEPRLGIGDGLGQLVRAQDRLVVEPLAAHRSDAGVAVREDRVGDALAADRHGGVVPAEVGAAHAAEPRHRVPRGHLDHVDGVHVAGGVDRGGGQAPRGDLGGELAGDHAVVERRRLRGRRDGDHAGEAPASDVLLRAGLPADARAAERVVLLQPVDVAAGGDGCVEVAHLLLQVDVDVRRPEHGDNRHVREDATAVVRDDDSHAYPSARRLHRGLSCVVPRRGMRFGGACPYTDV
jgi:hypothetical protein